MKGKIIVGPEAMLVERNGIRSRIEPLTAQDGPGEVLEKAKTLFGEIIRPVAWNAWVRHRMVMAWQRCYAAAVLDSYPGAWFHGPRPDLLARKTWKLAADGDWLTVPHGVAARVVRSAP